jgi:hypothetical protein
MLNGTSAQPHSKTHEGLTAEIGRAASDEPTTPTASCGSDVGPDLGHAPVLSCNVSGSLVEWRF